MKSETLIDSSPSNRKHPRVMGWFGTTALAMGGINQSIFLIGGLIGGQTFDTGQGAVGVLFNSVGISTSSFNISGQGTFAIPLLFLGLILAWMATPGWTELILMWPNRVGGIAATCGEAFRPYAPVLANLTGVCYWWGWVPTCGLTALLSGNAIHQWILPSIPVPAIACFLVVFFALINLAGVRWAMRLGIGFAIVSVTLAFVSALVPVLTHEVNWQQSCSFHLDTPFPGLFGQITSLMAGLYLIGFAAPAYEAAACHVGEMIDPEKNVPRAMLASALLALVYFLVLPVVWLGVIGSEGLTGDLAITLGPTFAPLFGAAGKAMAIGFMMFNMFHGTLAPLTGVARTLSQLSDDGLLPVSFGYRNRFDCPWVAIVVTAGFAILFLLIGDPLWMIAAANLTYLIGISLPNVAVWLLRRDQPDMHRPYRAPRGTIMLGLIAAMIWGVATILGFEQFGLPTVMFGIVLTYSGAFLYAWRLWSDHRKSGRPGIKHSLHIKLTGAMLLVLVLDGVGYLLAVSSVPRTHLALLAGLEDIFVAVALLTISVGLILPGMIAHSAAEVSSAARKLSTTTLADFSKAMAALGSGDLEKAHARVDIVPVVVHSRDELGEMAKSFNMLQEEVKRAATGLDGAREGLRSARDLLREANVGLEQRVKERTLELETAHSKIVDFARQAGMAQIASGVLHNVGNALNSVNVSVNVIEDRLRRSKIEAIGKISDIFAEHPDDLEAFLAKDPRGVMLRDYIPQLAEHLLNERAELLAELEAMTASVAHVKRIIDMQQSFARSSSMAELVDPAELVESALQLYSGDLKKNGIRVVREFGPVPRFKVDKHVVSQILTNLISNAVAAIDEGRINPGMLMVKIGLADQNPELVRIEFTDNGIGIKPEDMIRIFTYGFTTKEKGHGFGLHSASLDAGRLGGSLMAASGGPGKGASFALVLPVMAEESVA